MDLRRMDLKFEVRTLVAIRRRSRLLIQRGYAWIVPGRSLLGLDLGKSMPLYLGARPWNSNPRRINIWGDPILAMSVAPLAQAAGSSRQQSWTANF